jgi:hypothetical protein
VFKQNSLESFFAKLKNGCESQIRKIQISARHTALVNTMSGGMALTCKELDAAIE